MAVKNNRDYIGIDISEEYAILAKTRTDKELKIKNADLF
jgi:DNA modification methylase